MKKLTPLLIILFLTAIGFTQNYKCIIENEIHYFEGGGEWQTKAIQTDSVVSDSEDLVYYIYPTIQQGSEPWCYALGGPSWIGRKIIEKPNGNFIFLNLENEPITIKSQAEVSESWVCYEFENGDYIESSCESIETVEFMGIYDLAKKIGFQAYLSNGSPLENAVNDKHLLLSENHGFVKTLNFKVFPDLEDEVWYDGISEFEIIGIEGNESGVENLTWDKIFNFNIGDEIHTEKWVNSWPIGATYLDLFINVIIAKEEFLEGDSLVYQVKRCGSKKVTDNYGGIEYDFFNDTISKIYSKNGFGVNFLDTIAERMITIGDEEYHEYNYNIQFEHYYTNRTSKQLIEGLSSEYPHDCIEAIIINDKSPGISWGFYIEDLGGRYWNNYMYWEDSYQPVYFKTSDEEWGEPLNCDSLLVGFEQKYVQKQEIKIFPNPANDVISISSEGNKVMEVSFYNLNGQRILNVISPANVIDISSIKPGLYFAEIKTSEGNVMKKIIVQ